ncbi:MAG: glycosyltransferase [Flavobacteriales bacterium]
MKILATLSRFPYPSNKGDKLRAYHQLKYLAINHEVHLFCLSDEVVDDWQIKHMQEYFASIHVFKLNKASIGWRLLLNFFGHKPFQVAYFTDATAKKKLMELREQIQPDLIYSQLVRMAEYVRDMKGVQKFIDYQDAFSKGLQRRLKFNNWFKRIFINMEYKRMKSYEESVFDDFDQCGIISLQDANHFPASQRNRFHIIPNGIDSDYFAPAGLEKKIDLLFTGNMQYEPNVNCVHYIIQKVLPLLFEKYPDLYLMAAGTSPVPSLRRAEGRHLKLTGWVDDLRDYYDQARIFIAPLQISIGMQNKILEAMSMGLPVITTSICNNPIGAKHARDLIVADTPFDCAMAIEQLLSNPEMAKEIGQNARKFIEKKFKWDKQNARLPFVYVETM